MLPDRVLNSGPMTYKSGAPPIALCGPASHTVTTGRRASVSEAGVSWHFFSPG